MNKTTILLGTFVIGVAIFTAIEVATLALWFQGSTPAVVFSTGGKLALAVGLLLEHAVSAIVGVAVVAGIRNIRFG
jgi:hypothetical protein